MAHFIRLRATKAAAVAVASGGTYAFLRDPSVSANDRGGGGPALESFRSKIGDPYAVVPPRAVQESALIGASPANPLDILVVGGGATGCGVALDATTRGLRVGLVEREDFSSGTSSRSTKLLHGGNSSECVDYLVYIYMLIWILWLGLWVVMKIVFTCKSMSNGTTRYGFI